MQATHQTTTVFYTTLEVLEWLISKQALPSSPARPCDVVIQICISLLLPNLSAHFTLQLGRQKCPSQYEDELPVIIVTT